MFSSFETFKQNYKDPILKNGISSMCVY